jgi:LCP family protein required for cell wall assembly
VVVLLVVGTVVGYGWYLNHQIHRVDVKGLTPGATTGADAGTENILMIGSTSRCALTVQNPAYGLCQNGVNGVNSDVIMILHLNPSKRTVSILSIPRDLFLPNARSGANGAYKIDAALYEGQSQLINVIREDFGIPIQHSVELNFDTFANVVNALGGINMYFPMPVFDAYSGLNVPAPGCIHLDGYRALQVVRARHLQYKGPGVTTNDHAYWPYEVHSDLGRINRDHEFLRVLATEVSKRGLGNPITDEKLVASVAPQLTVDSGFSATDMVHLILDFHSVNINKAPETTLPVSVGPNISYQWDGKDEGDIEFPAAVPAQKAIDTFLQISPDTNTMTGAPLPAPSSVTVSVLNGSGAYNQGPDTEAALEALGFQGVGVGSTPVLASQLETLVQYSSPSNEGAAEAVARSMSGAVILSRGPTTDGAQVTVITGTQFAVNPPASTSTSASGTSTSTSASGTSTSTSASGTSASTSASVPEGSPGTVAAAAGFQPPSPSNPSLTPWDPRACTASGGEGS